MFFKKDFKRISLKVKRNYVSITRKAKKKSLIPFKITLPMIAACVLLFLVLPALIAGAWFYKNILMDLPSISEIENISFSQTTNITDRNGEVLYKLFEENRQYISFDQISPNMVKAVIATEDRNFWTNPWIDIYWILRAWIRDFTSHGGPTEWGSTLTQQLIKKLLLTDEKTLTRKLKEAVLAFQMNDYILSQVKQNYGNLSSAELDRKVKEKIFELYVNYVFFWNNNHWVETASKSYFWTSANNLDILQAAVLAWIPQRPTYLNPYSGKDALMWTLSITDPNWKDSTAVTGLQTAVVAQIEKKLNDSSLSFQKSTEDVLNFLKWLLDFPFTYEGVTYQVTYKNWRKDIVLASMYEENYIDQPTFKKEFIKWFTIQFQKNTTEIKAPHFVFWVIDQLKEQYGQDVLMKWWLTIKTSLDYNIQKIAEASALENQNKLKQDWANNTAFIYLDSKNWDILSYVGSLDYYNEDINGQVDMIQALRQPWSTMKPLLYSLGLMKFPLTIDSPIYDLPFSVWENKPQNVDGIFNGLMPIKEALAASRNIPAIKMYFAVGEDQWFKPFLKTLGINSLSDKTYYGYPLAIGAWELKLFELATAYSHLSAWWKPAKINPILEVRWPDWSILYSKTVEYEKQIIPSGVASMMWEILSNLQNMPASWRARFTFNDIKMATKSWTTNIRLKNNQSLPRDWWLVAYTPSKVSVFWAWNTKWDPLKATAYGGWLNAPAWRGFFTELKNRGRIANEDMPQSEVKKVTISRITWKLAWTDTPPSFVASSVWYIENLPAQFEDSVKKIQIDTLCNGLISETTPPGSIAQAYIINPNLDYINYRDSDDVKQWWQNSGNKIMQAKLWAVILSEEPTQECGERDQIAQNGWVALQILSPAGWAQSTNDFSIKVRASWPFPIKSIEVMLDRVVLTSQTYSGSTDLTDFLRVKASGIADWKYSFNVIVRDQQWYETQKSIDVNIVSQDTAPPSVNRDDMQIQENWDGKYSASINFSDALSSIQGWTIYEWDTVLTTFNWSRATFTASNMQNVFYEVKDNKWNSTWKKALLD